MQERGNMVSAEKEARQSQVNLPNALTMLRLLLVPVFLWLLLQDTTESRWWAFGVFAVAAYTDHLDGALARSRNLITTFGKLADPLADKFLTLGAFVALSVLGDLPWVFTIIVAVREIGITILREVLRRKGVVVAASSGGKLKTVLQIALILLLIPMRGAYLTGTAASVADIVILLVGIAALVVTVWSGLQYVLGATKSGDA